MEKKRKIRTYGGYFEAFMETLTEKEQDKIQYGLLLLKTQERLSTKFVKFVQDGVFELRTPNPLKDTLMRSGKSEISGSVIIW